MQLKQRPRATHWRLLSAQRFKAYGWQVIGPVDGHDVPVPHFGVVLEMTQWEALARRLRDHGVRFVIEPTIRFKGQPGEHVPTTGTIYARLHGSPRTYWSSYDDEALDALEGGLVPSICLIDWNMPLMDGYTFVTRVRADPRWRDVTLMMVTTESEQRQIVRALAAGAHEYVIKPFTADAIRDKLALLGLLPEEVVL